MKKKHLILPLCIVGGALLSCVVAACVFGALFFAKGYGVSVGKLRLEEGAASLQTDETTLSLFDGTRNKNLFSGLRSGDKILLLHGMLRETCPVQTDGFYALRLAKAEDPAAAAKEASASPSHTHAQTEKEHGGSGRFPVYCGNIETTVTFEDGKSYPLVYENSVALTDLLALLPYDPEKVCNCRPEYSICTEFGIYGVNLTERYARCSDGQAALTEQQTQKIKTILQWAKEHSTQENSQ